ncbi:MAG: CoA activase [Deltaproteobacteria bacterium]|nr:CoA activase [Deltaproteobacteria bacterium]
MIGVGLDVGNQRIKAVILKKGQILSFARNQIGVNIRKSTERAVEQALEKAGLRREDVARIVTTGAGGSDVALGDLTFSSVYCDSVGVAWLFPRAVSGVDLGYEDCQVFKCDENGKLIDSETNEKCAAGAGAFLDLIPKALGVPIEEAGPLSIQSKTELPLTTVCAVFAESEAISLVHRGEKIPDVLRAAYDAVASKTASLLRKILPDENKDVVLIGGVAKNSGFVDCFRNKIRSNLIIPENPDIVGALGAGLLALGKDKES